MQESGQGQGSQNDRHRQFRDSFQDDPPGFLHIDCFYRPYTPETSGLVERLNDPTEEATPLTRRYGSAEQRAEAPRGWFVRYNFYRRHRRLGSETPYKVYLS